MDKIWEKIKAMAEDGDGFIRTSQVEGAGVSRSMLKKYMDAGKIERVRKGIYTITDGFADEYALIQAQNSKVIFSYGTALFLWEMSDRAPHFIDVTVPRGTNASIIKRDNENLRVHHVLEKYYEIGLAETQSHKVAWFASMTANAVSVI